MINATIVVIYALQHYRKKLPSYRTIATCVYISLTITIFSISSFSPEKPTVKLFPCSITEIFMTPMQLEWTNLY